MSGLLSLLDGAAVCIYGTVLSAAFSGICWDRHKRILLAVDTALMLALQGAAYFVLGYRATQQLYPLITHLPLVLVLCALGCGKVWSVICVLIAYLCCQLRRWLALIAALFIPGSAVQGIAELLLTPVLLVLLVRYAAPSIRQLSASPLSVQLQCGIVPALGYCFDYLTQVYTHLLTSGNPVAVEFMFFVSSASYLAFVLYLLQQERVRSDLEQAQNTLNLQITQAAREISALRQSQHTASIYRHDLRHHLQYLSACIENGMPDRAQEYIHTVCSEIEASRVTTYCENEAANLIFSAFAARAENAGVGFAVHAAISQTLPMPENDLCVLLSNALENALHACGKLRDDGEAADIAVSAYEKDHRLFLQVTNSCREPVHFVQGVPAADRPGHGLGVRSICTIAERYGGIYSFAVQDGRFILRIAL